MTTLEQIKKEGETRLVRKLETHGCATNTIANALEILRSTVDSVAQAAVVGREERLTKRVYMLRQWLNEDRITDHTKLVSNEDIFYRLELPPTLEDGAQKTV